MWILREIINRLHIVLSLFLVVAASSNALAEQLNRLTYVASKDLEILYAGEKGKWCNPRLDIVLITSQPLVLQNENLATKQIAKLIQKLRQSCPKIVKVGLSGYSRMEPEIVVIEGSYVADDDWKFSKLKLPERFVSQSGNASVGNTAQKPAVIVAPGNAGEPNRSLSFEESVELQKRLSFLGFAIGKIDGKPGRKTTFAISRFLKTYNLNLPVRPDLDVLNSLRRVAATGNAGRVIITKNPKPVASINLGNYLDTGDRNQVNTGRLFAMRAAARNIKLLNDSQVVNRWLNIESRDKYSPIQQQANYMKRLYKNGTKFDKKDTLSNFSKLISDEIAKRRAELNQPLSLLIRFPARVSGDYISGAGFPLSMNYSNKQDFRLQERAGAINHRLGRIGVDLNIPLPNQSFVSVVPILDERKARILARLLQNRRRYKFELQYYVTMKETKDTVRANSSISTEAKISRLALVLIDGNRPYAKPKLVYKWGLSPPKNASNSNNPFSTRKLTPIEFANWAKISLLGGNLVMNRSYDKIYSNIVIDFQGLIEGGQQRDSVYTKYDDGWAKFYNLLKIQHVPEYLDNTAITIAAARIFLTEREKAELTRGKKFLVAGLNSGNYNEFEFRDFVSRFKAGKYMSRLKRYYPKLPIPIVDIIPARLGKYNFELKQYPIYFYDNKEREWKPSFWKPDLYVNLHRKFDLQRYPKKLLLSAENARFLANSFARNKNHNRTVYLAVFAEMQAYDDERSMYDVASRKVGLYLDSTLTKNITIFPLEDLTSP